MTIPLTEEAGSDTMGSAFRPVIALHCTCGAVMGKMDARVRGWMTLLKCQCGKRYDVAVMATERLDRLAPKA